jgi:hypothetical protein
MAVLQQPVCVEAYGLSRSQIAAFEFHGKTKVKQAQSSARCPWLIVSKDAGATLSGAVDMSLWHLQATTHHPSDRFEDLLLYQRWEVERF